MKIAVIGAGYVGLVSGACFADLGHEVTCIDRDLDKIDALQKGIVPIYEPGLKEIIGRRINSGNLRFSSSLSEGVIGAAVIFIAVGTPSRDSDGRADLSYVYEASLGVAAHLEPQAVIVIKSTVPIGTGDEVERLVFEERGVSDFSIVSNPEFLREGSAISDFNNPDRVVIGVCDHFARNTMAELYHPLAQKGVPILFTGRRTSELVKYAANAFLATKLTFINEIADLCEKVGADVQDVSRGIGMDGRIGPKFLQAGPGYGGSCFPKDTIALLKTAEDHCSSLRIVNAVCQANDGRKRAMGRKVIDALGGSELARGQKVAILGLTFKPNTDDMRESPAIPVIQALMDAHVHIVGFDPEGMARARDVIPNLNLAEDPYVAIQGADACILMTEWDLFKSLDFDRIKSQMRKPILIDFRNLYDPGFIRGKGYCYYGIGRA